MIKTILLSAFCFFIQGNIIQAQTKEQAIKELTKIFQYYDYEVMELSPCKVHVKKNILDDAYVEYEFAPNEALWDGKDFGLRADWTVIREKKYFKGKTTTRNLFVLPFVNENKTVHAKIADQINTLANFCRLQIQPNEITDKDLALFLFTEQSYHQETAPLREQLKKDLANYQTDADKLYDIYLLESNGHNIDGYTKTEREEEAKAKPLLKAYADQSFKKYNDYFESVWAGMPERQFRTIGEELTSDKELLERARKVRDGMQQ
jgi:hypothetical protein